MRERRFRRSETQCLWQAGWVGLLSAWLVVAPPGLPRVFANPEGEQVVVGEASFERDAAGQRLDIHTVTDLTVVNFGGGASVGTGEVLNVHQPTDEVSQFWARDGSGRATHIDGSVWSNAQVGYLNPYGIFLGGEALLDVSTFVAGAGDISNEDLLAGRLHFRELTGEVGVAAGAEILASEAVLLAGRRVAHYGHIRAPGGMVAFAAGGEVLLSEIEGRLRVRAEAPPLDSDAWGIEQGGHVDAPGGYVSLTAGDHYSLALNHSGITRARDIEVSGGVDGLVEVSGTLDASDSVDGAKGGKVKVLGERIALRGAQIDASGDAGGGEILVGGDFQGANPELRNASRTYVSADTRLTADAVTRGDGGKVIVWADEVTGFAGQISARGGVESGDGGFAEVSGKQTLVYRGFADLRAPGGATGTLLLDPTDITITSGSDAGSLDPELPDVLAGDPDAEPNTISQGALEGLAASANIVLQADNDVTLNDLASDVLNLAIDSENAGSLSILADADADGSGDFAMLGSDDSIVTAGGSVSITGANVTAFAIRTDGAESSAESDAQPGGDVTLRATAGNLSVEEISARGGDSLGLPGSGAAGGRVTLEAIGTEEGGGDVRVGFDASEALDPVGIDASGGAGSLAFEQSGSESAPVYRLVGGRGGTGGVVSIDGSGEVRVGNVSANGGNTSVPVDWLPGGAYINGSGSADVNFLASAGQGGEIGIDGGSEDEGAEVLLLGDLEAMGGAGAGEVVYGIDPESLETRGVSGGVGGILRVAGEGVVRLGEAGAPVELNASGGSSEKGEGGRARGFLFDGFGLVPDAPAILVGREAGATGAEAVVGDIYVYGSLIANGGAGINDGLLFYDGGGGWVELRSAEASVFHEGAIQVDGGESLGGSGDVSASGGGLFFDDLGGEAGVFIAEAGTHLTVGSVSARGGDSATGEGGGENFASQLLVPGVEPVSILLRSGIDDSVETPGGDVTVTGLLDVSGGNGYGEYRPSDLVPEEGGAALAPPQGGGNAGRILIQPTSGSVTLEGGARGVAGLGELPVEPCADCLSGGDGLAGLLQIDAQGEVTAQSLEAGFERISVEQADEEATTRLFALVDGAQSPLLEVAAAGPPQEGESRQQTVTILASPQDFGALSYRLNVPAPEAEEGSEETPVPPVVGIEFARGLGELRSSGGLRHEIFNDNGGVTGVSEGSGAHLQLSGGLRVEAMDVTNLEVAGIDAGGTPSGILALVVGGETDGEGGEVALDVTAPLGALEIEQREATAAISVTGMATLAASSAGVPGGEFTVSQASSPTGMSLLLGHTPSDDTSLPFVVATNTQVGGDLSFRSSGALSLGENAITMTSGGNVALSAAGDIASADAEPAGALVTGAHTLLLETRGEGNANVTVQDVQALAADVAGDLVVDFAFSGESGGNLEISHGAVGDVASLNLDLSGIEAGGAVTLTAGDPAQSQIRLAESGGAAPIQVRSGGDQFYDADALEIANVREDPELAGAFLNDAELVSTGGGIEFGGRVDTAADALGEGDLVPATLTIESQDATTFGGNVGGARALARLETNDVELGGDPERSFLAGELAFLGSIDGAAEASFHATADAVPGQGGTLVFGGNIGTVTELAGLEAKADQIEFTGAERVVVGAEGIDLNVDWPRTEVPDVATITDTQGNIAFETSGDFKVGHFQTQPPGALGDVEKFSALGALRIQAQSVEVGDLSAESISITSNSITAVGRSAGEVLLSDGETTVMDSGVDWVANDIATSSAVLEDPAADAADLAPVKFVIGSGGVSVPESFVGVEVVRFGDDLAAVEASSFQGAGGQILDLTGSGPRLIGVPTQEIPRPEPPVDPFVPPQFGDQEPAPALPVDALGVLALLDCAAGECPEVEFALSHPERGPLATPRAEEIARHYREWVSGAEARLHLRASFQVAGDAFRALFPETAFSGRVFYDFLAASEVFAETRGDLDNLAELFAQVELLGLTPLDAAVVQERLALEFASAAALPGFDAPAVVAAVQASPIGLLR